MTVPAAIHIVTIYLGHDAPNTFVCVNPSKYLLGKLKLGLTSAEVRGLNDTLFRATREKPDKVFLLTDAPSPITGIINFHQYFDSTPV